MVARVETKPAGFDIRFALHECRLQTTFSIYAPCIFARAMRDMRNTKALDSFSHTGRSSLLFSCVVSKGPFDTCAPGLPLQRGPAASQLFARPSSISGQTASTLYGCGCPKSSRARGLHSHCGRKAENKGSQHFVLPRAQSERSFACGFRGANYSNSFEKVLTQAVLCANSRAALD